MSNYLFAMGKEKLVKTLHDSLSKPTQDSDSEITLHKHSNGVWVLVVEKRQPHIHSSIIEVDHSTGEKENVFFRGWLQDHDAEAIVLGKNGFKRYCAQHRERPLLEAPIDLEGAFVLAAWNGDSIVIQNDLYSLFPVVYCCTGDMFLASDSLYMISHSRRILGIPCKLNRRVAIGKAWKTYGIASAPLSNDTIIQDVRLLSPGKHVEVTIGSGVNIRSLRLRLSRKLVATTVSRDLCPIFESEVDSYLEALNGVIGRMFASIHRLVVANGTTVEFGLSGGLDSRVLLGVCLQSKEIMDSLYITTSTHQARRADFDVVESLSNCFGFKFNDVENSKRLAVASIASKSRVSNVLGLWALANLGLYDSVYLTKEIWNFPAAISMGGQGAETIKDTWGGASIAGLISEGVRPEVRESILAQMHESLESVGIDPLDENAVKWHHLAYKSAFHNGRFVTASSLCLRPFLQQSIFAVSQAECNPFSGSGRDGPTICHDLLILLNPDLATHLYDSPEKDITEEYAAERMDLFERNPVTLEELSPYSICGDVKDIANGPPDCFLSTVEQFVLNGMTVQEKLTGLLEENWERIQDRDLRRMYKHVYKEGLDNLVESGSELSFSGAYAARICSFMLVDADTI